MNKAKRMAVAVSLCLLMVQPGAAIVPGYAVAYRATPPLVLALPEPYRGEHGRAD